jgi:hypothetical protein
MYGYSHPLTPHTYMDDFGGVHYRRRKEDRWVTPHIPALLELMHCYIFVDVCVHLIILNTSSRDLITPNSACRFLIPPWMNSRIT